MVNEKYALVTTEIENAVTEFSGLKDSYDIRLSKKDDSHIIYKVRKDNAEVTLTFYLLKGGMTSHQVQPSQGLANLKSVANECWEYVVEKTHIKCVDCNFFRFCDVSEDDFNTLVAIASDDHNYSVIHEENPSKNFNSRKTIVDSHGARLSLNYYNNGTLTLQGAISPMFTYVWTDCVSLLGDIDATEREQFISYATGEGIVRIDPDLSKHIENFSIIEGTKLDILAEVSCKLVNLGKAYEENAWIPFCILKALDGLMSKKMQEAGDFGNKDSYTKFLRQEADGSEYYVFKDEYTCFDVKPALKKALEEGYSFLCKQRNTSFHIDRKNTSTSRIVSYEEAVEIIEETLKLMNRICKNW